MSLVDDDDGGRGHSENDWNPPHRSLPQALNDPSRAQSRETITSRCHARNTGIGGDFPWEFEGRHNNRPLDTADQMAATTRNAEGKRLRYDDLIEEAV